MSLSVMRYKLVELVGAHETFRFCITHREIACLHLGTSWLMVSGDNP